MSYDVDAILSANPIETVIGSRIALTKAGNEFLSCCPFHSEKTPSFSVIPAKDMYYCFGCQAHGDAIDFIREYEGVDFKTACAIMGGEQAAPGHTGATKRTTKIIKDIYAEITPIVPVPDGVAPILPGEKTDLVWNPKREKDTTYIADTVFPYKDSAGALIGYVLRIDFADGKKITPAIMWCRWIDGEGLPQEGWCHYSFPPPRPLYGLDILAARAKAQVLVVEGEKTADAARLLLPSYVVITWPGGSGAVSKADWTPLMGRKVAIWPDADQPGADAGEMVAMKALDAGAAEVRIIDWDKTQVKGWDAADALADGWTTTQTIAWAKKRIRTVLPVDGESANGRPVALETTTGANPEEEPPLFEPSDAPERPQEPLNVLAGISGAPQTPLLPTEAPFQALGHFHGRYYYLPRGTQQIVELSPSEHNKQNFTALAPLSWWEMTFPSKTGVSWDTARNALMRQSESRGYFNPYETIRGRGAWVDGGRAILHLGETIYVDNHAMKPHEVESKYIYEGNTNLECKVETPATNAEAHLLVEICEQLSWTQKISAALLVGWCIIAPVCGILRWRPHIWITGPTGSGKSTILDGIIRPVLGAVGLYITGKTSEAGIRHQLHHDARPVIFDEAEAEDKHNAQLMDAIIGLARISSSGGHVYKGTQGGGGISYIMRSCFCFSSINPPIKHFADESRITRLVLQKDIAVDAPARWNELKKQMLDVLTPEYSQRLFARSLKNLKTLQTNCETFADAATLIFPTRRMADQIGTILAGTYLCHSTKLLTREQASEWLQRQDWTEQTIATEQKDEERLLERLASQRTRVGVVDVTLGELILVAYASTSNSEIAPNIGISTETAKQELGRWGIKTMDDGIVIANRCEALKKILADTPWVGGWARPLKDLDGATSYPPQYFSPGINSRGVWLPIKYFQEGE